MNPRFAHLLVRLYPRPWRERYGAEFGSFLETGRGGLLVMANVVWSALCEHLVPTRGGTMNQRPQSSRFQSWCIRAPWAMFGLAPLFLLAAAYFVACFILWSGWRLFLPESSTPFVRIHGLAIAYFGVGRALYFGAPILIGWSIALIAARQKIKAVWPLVSLLLISLISVSAQVRATRPVEGGAGHVSMNFALGHSVQSISSALLHAQIIFSLMVLPYVVLRLRKAYSLSA